MLLDHWLILLCLFLALALGAAALINWRRHNNWAWQYYLPALVLASYGLGATVQPILAAFDVESWWWLGLALALIAFAGFVFMFGILLRTGFWSAPVGYALTGLFFFGLGDFSGRATADGLSFAGAFLLSMRSQEPWWLLLLVLVPVLIWTSWRNLISLGPTRRWLVLGFRCALIVFLALALSEVFARKPTDHVTVIFVWDRSLSIPPEKSAQGRDLREERLFDFINRSVAMRGTQHANDQVGVVVFGKQPRLELPPSVVPRLNFAKIRSQVDSSYTDIAAAMKLALASFPEGYGKRIVLISDGNENMGRAEEQARIAKQNGVQVDIVPIDAKRNQQNEILIERLEAPPVTEKDARLPLRVVIRSFHPQIVVAQLNVRKVTFGQDVDLKPDAKNSTTIELRQGLNVYYFQQGGAKDDSVFSYEATVVPLGVKTHEGAWVHKKGLPGDRVENNAARVSVMSRGQRTILLLESEKGRHQLLVDRLQAVKSSLKVVALTIDNAREDRKEDVNELHHYTKGDNERLAAFLSKFDAVILANLPANALTEAEQKVLRSQVHEQGIGLVMIGGHQSFGAGGWQNTEVEKALPVNMDLKSMKVDGKSGLVLIMHASEMAEGNAWQRKIAKLALEKLSPMDMVGQIHYDHGFNGGAPGHRWHIPFQEIGANRNRLIRLTDSMQPGDMPDLDPALLKAHTELTNDEYRLGTRHIILISDGDHWDASPGVMTKLRKAKISCTTVCITTHGQNEVRKMVAVAQAAYQPGGRSYHIKDPRELPAIYIKETRLLSQSFIHEGRFEPQLMSREGPTEGIRDLQPLHGFVRTTPKESSLVRMLIETPVIGQHKFPILAAWQYGLGRSVAFTSDARTLVKGSVFWDRDWANSDLYAKFWEQTADWVLRPGESGQHLFLTTEHKDGKIRIIVEAQEADKSPITDAELRAGITSPLFKVKDDRRVELKFEQKNAGIYEAEIPADEVGAYFINIQAKWKREIDKDGKKITEDLIDTVHAGVTIPYSPEFAEMESNPSLLERLRALTGGKSFRDNADVLEEAARISDVFRRVPESHASLQPLWPWFVFLTAVCLLFDVAIRRIAIQPEAVWAYAVGRWEKLRGRASAEEPLPAYIERLKSRKAQVSETMDKAKAAKKFEAAAGAPVASAPTTAPVTPVEKPKPAPAPKKEEEEADFATRLMRAKKKAMEERDKEKPK